MRLVDHQQPDPLGEQRQHRVAELRVVEPLRADQQQVDRVGGEQRRATSSHAVAVRRVDRVRADPEPLGRGDLVAHQREQRRDDQRRPGAPLAQQRGGEEVDGRLAPARSAARTARARGRRRGRAPPRAGAGGTTRPGPASAWSSSVGAGLDGGDFGHLDHSRTLAPEAVSPPPVTSRPGDRVPGACPLDCPDGCAWLVTVRDGEAVQPARQSRPPVHARRAVQQGRAATSTTRARPTGCCTRCAASAPKGEGRFERISWDDALDEIAERLLGAIRERARRRGDLAVPGHGDARLPPGPRGPRGRAALERARRQRARDDDLLDRRQRSACATRLGTNRGIDPEAFRHAKLILLWGSNPLTSHHHIWKFVTRRAPATAPTSS